MISEQYFEQIYAILHKIEKQESPAIAMLADQMTATVQAGHAVYIFGCTHAGILAEEAFYRAGGLAIMNPLFIGGLLTSNSPVALTSQLERQEGYCSHVPELSGMQKGGLLLLHSVSGRNPASIDLALAARRLGVYVAVITAMSYAGKVASRHSSGKLLYEMADLVLDDHCPVGDALVGVGQTGMRVAPASTIAGCAILDALVAEVADRFAALGEPLPVYQSVNVDGSDAYNQKMLERYRRSIRYPVAFKAENTNTK